MTQVLPAALVAPTRPGQSVGYQIRAVDGTTIATAFTTTGVTEVSATGYYRVNGGITAPDDGGTLEWYINNAGAAGAFLSAVAIDPAPNQADQAAGIRSALGLASANLDGQFGDIPTTTQIWSHATRALTDKDNFNLASSQTFSTTGSVGSVTGAVGSVTGSVGSVTGAVTVGTLNNNVITANSINPGAITNAKFAAGAINATVVADNTITDTKIASNAVTAAKIASGAITNTKFAAGAVDATAIATDAINATKIADNAIDGGALATNAIEKIQANLATQASVDTKASQASVNALPNAGTIADTVWDELLSGHTIAGSTGKKLADTSTLTVGDIPPGLTAQQVWEYATRALTGTQATNLANISNIPTNPLLTNDARLNNLDTTISSRSTLTAAQIRTELATELARLDVAVSTRLAAANYTTPPTTSQIAAAVEAALLNDADGQKLLEAIKDTVQALFDAQADVPVSTLVGLIADRITTDHGSGSYTTANVSALALEATAQAIRAKTDNLPSDPADQSELVTLINTRLAAADYVAPDNTGILTAIGALPSASTITNSVWNATLSNYTGPGSTGAKLGLASTLTVGDIPAGLTAQQVWEYATRTLTIASGLTNDQNIRLNEVWRQLGLDINNPVTRIRNLSTGVITEQLGPGGIQIVHSEQNDGNTIITTRQP